MIRNQWYIVLDSRQVKKKLVGVTRLGEKLLFRRDKTGKVFCLKDRCVHRGASLSRGKIVDEHIQCPFHGFKYDSSGRVIEIPANGADMPVEPRYQVESYPVYEGWGFIWIWWGEGPPQGIPYFFDELDKKFTYAQLIDPWKTHYSRAIENQLDTVHLPFVHYDTIGKGQRTVVDGPVVRWLDENRFVFYVYNHKENGIPARKADEMPEPDPEKDFKLFFVFPNLWQNYIHKKARAIAAFVPVDEENSLIYVRFYQCFITLPFLRSLFSKLAMPFNRKILHQDRRVVETQEPKASALKMGEQLIPGDKPIVEYRKRRQELQKLQQSTPVNT